MQRVSVKRATAGLFEVAGSEALDDQVGVLALHS